MKYLVAGLGNPGAEYVNTRHNIGFEILDNLAEEKEAVFESKRLADYTLIKHKGRQFHLIKPNTYMNLSGRAVKYWMDKLKIPADRILVLLDDIALPIGKLRLKPNGSDGGHNGLKSIIESIGTRDYARLRFGVGNDFHSGQQVNYVLGKWSNEDQQILGAKIKTATEIIINFGTIGIERTMNRFNNK